MKTIDWAVPVAKGVGLLTVLAGSMVALAYPVLEAAGFFG